MKPIHQMRPSAPSVSPDGIRKDVGPLGRTFDTMSTYAEKSKSSEWFEFRNAAINKYGTLCTTCGQSSCRDAIIQIHHKRYIKGREPWEYDLDDVSVICSDCHKEIHRCEDSWRDMIRALPSWLVLEFQSLADELAKLDDNTKTTVASYAKNQARRLYWESKLPEGISEND